MSQENQKVIYSTTGIEIRLDITEEMVDRLAKVIDTSNVYELYKGDLLTGATIEEFINVFYSKLFPGINFKINYSIENHIRFFNTLFKKSNLPFRIYTAHSTYNDYQCESIEISRIEGYYLVKEIYDN